MADRGLHHVAAVTAVFLHTVVEAVHHVGVVTRAADQGVGALAAIQAIGALSASDQVVLGVARAVYVGTAQKFKFFEVGGEAVADAGAHHVRAFASDFLNEIAHSVHAIDVVASTTAQGVVAQATVQLVGARVADDQVVEVVAAAIEVGTAAEFQVFDVGAQGQGDGGLDAVAALLTQLGYHIAQVVHHVAVVACATGQGVGALSTIQAVGADIAF